MRIWIVSPRGSTATNQGRQEGSGTAVEFRYLVRAAGSRYVVWAAVAVACVVSLPARVRAQPRRAGCAPLALALFVLALANPSITREDRDPLTSVAVVVIDKSPSQDFGDRTAADRSGARRARRAARTHPRASRCASSRPARPTARPTARGCSRRCPPRSSDVPHDRVAGAIIDHRRARARRADRGRGARLCGAGACADHRPRATSATAASCW